MESKHIRLINAFIVSAILAVVAIVALTIGGELYKPLKDWLKTTFSHHWIGKGVFSFAGFYILGFILTIFVGKQEKTMATLLFILFWAGLLGALAIVGFYYYETFLVPHN